MASFIDTVRSIIFWSLPAFLLPPPRSKTLPEETHAKNSQPRFRLVPLEERVVLDAAAAVHILNSYHLEAVKPMPNITMDSHANGTMEQANKTPIALDPVSVPNARDGAIHVLAISSDVTDPQVLEAAAKESAYVVFYNAKTTTLDQLSHQIQDTLHGQQADSIAFVNNGQPGQFALTSNIEVSLNSLNASPALQSFWTNIGGMVKDGGQVDLLSCYVGSNTQGQALVSNIDTLLDESGHNIGIAAATTKVGNANEGGSWSLNVGNVGTIDAASMYFNAQPLASWTGTLDPQAALIADVNPGTSFSNPQHFVAAGNHVFFTATDSSGHVNLYETTGASGSVNGLPTGNVIEINGNTNITGEQLLGNSSNPHYLYSGGTGASNPYLFYFATDRANYLGLFAFNETTQVNTELSFTTVPAVNQTVGDPNTVIGSQGLVVNNVLFYNGFSVHDGAGLWSANPISGLVQELTSPPDNSPGGLNVFNLVQSNGIVYFSATDWTVTSTSSQTTSTTNEPTWNFQAPSAGFSQSPDIINGVPFYNPYIDFGGQEYITYTNTTSQTTTNITPHNYIMSFNPTTTSSHYGQAVIDSLGSYTPTEMAALANGDIVYTKDLTYPNLSTEIDSTAVNGGSPTVTVKLFETPQGSSSSTLISTPPLPTNADLIYFTTNSNGQLGVITSVPFSSTGATNVDVFSQWATSNNTLYFAAAPNTTNPTFVTSGTTSYETNDQVFAFNSNSITTTKLTSISGGAGVLQVIADPNPSDNQAYYLVTSSSGNELFGVGSIFNGQVVPAAFQSAAEFGAGDLFTTSWGDVFYTSGTTNKDLYEFSASNPQSTFKAVSFNGGASSDVPTDSSTYAVSYAVAPLFAAEGRVLFPGIWNSFGNEPSAIDTIVSVTTPSDNLGNVPFGYTLNNFIIPGESTTIIAEAANGGIVLNGQPTVNVTLGGSNTATGTLTSSIVNGLAEFNFTPSAGAAGVGIFDFTYSLTYSISYDGGTTFSNLTSTPGTVSMNILPSTAPTAANQNVNLTEGQFQENASNAPTSTPNTYTGQLLVGNTQGSDTYTFQFWDAGPLGTGNLSSFGTANDGAAFNNTINLSSNGAFTYTITANSNRFTGEPATGTDFFDYIITDTNTGKVSNVGVVTFTISPDKVQVTNGSGFTAFAGAMTGAQPLMTFKDGAGDTLPSDYTATVNWGDGSNNSIGQIVYNAGTQTFTVFDSHQYSNTGTDNIQVTITHDATPSTNQIASDLATVSSLGSLVVPVTPSVNFGNVPEGGFSLSNFVIPNQLPAAQLAGQAGQESFHLISSTSSGLTGTIDSNGLVEISYPTNTTAVGLQSFTYQVTMDNNAIASTPGTITFFVYQPIPTPATVNDTILENSSNNSLSIFSSPDLNGAPLTLNVTNAPQHGTVSLIYAQQADGTEKQVLVYTPNANYIGSDSFSYYLSDGFPGNTNYSPNITATVTDSINIATNSNIQDFTTVGSHTYFVAQNTSGTYGLYEASMVNGAAVSTLITGQPGQWTSIGQPASEGGAIQGPTSLVADNTGTSLWFWIPDPASLSNAPKYDLYRFTPTGAVGSGTGTFVDVFNGPNGAPNGPGLFLGDNTSGHTEYYYFAYGNGYAATDTSSAPTVVELTPDPGSFSASVLAGSYIGTTPTIFFTGSDSHTAQSGIWKDTTPTVANSATFFNTPDTFNPSSGPFITETFVLQGFGAGSNIYLGLSADQGNTFQLWDYNGSSLTQVTGGYKNLQTSMAYDAHDGVVYFAALDSSGNNGIYAINTATPTTSFLVSQVPDASAAPQDFTLDGNTLFYTAYTSPFSTNDMGLHLYYTGTTYLDDQATHTGHTVPIPSGISTLSFIGNITNVDNTNIAFEAISGGVNELFIYNIPTNLVTEYSSTQNIAAPQSVPLNLFVTAGGSTANPQNISNFQVINPPLATDPVNNLSGNLYFAGDFSSSSNPILYAVQTIPTPQITGTEGIPTTDTPNFYYFSDPFNNSTNSAKYQVTIGWGDDLPVLITSNITSVSKDYQGNTFTPAVASFAIDLPTHTYDHFGGLNGTISISDIVNGALPSDGYSLSNAPFKAMIAPSQINLSFTPGGPFTEGSQIQFTDPVLGYTAVATFTLNDDRNLLTTPGVTFSANINWGNVIWTSGAPQNDVITFVSSTSTTSTYTIEEQGIFQYTEAGTKNVSINLTETVSGIQYHASQNGTLQINDAGLNAGTFNPNNSSGVEGAQLATTGTAPSNAPSNAIWLGTFTDNNPNPSSDLVGTINWGDANGFGSTSALIYYDSQVGGKAKYDVYGTYTYAEEGTKSVSIRINDPEGSSTSLSGNLIISDPAVTATGGFAFNGVEGATSASQTVATFTDPGGAEALADYTATIDWGDGGATSAGIITFDNNTGLFTVSGAHKYAEEGSNTITVTIIHDTAPNTIVTSTASISDPAVIASGGFSVTAVEGTLSAPQTVATFTDSGGAEALSNYNATINWGDGNQSAGTITYNSGTGVFTVTGAHQYANEGSDTVTVTILHDAAPNTIVTSSASVSDPAVILTGGFAFTAVEGTTSASQTVATFTDPGGPEALADYSAIINWGDGGPTSAGTITFNSGTGVFTVSGAHNYVEEGNDSISVTVLHDTAPNASETTIGAATVSDPSVIASGVAQINKVEGASSGVITLATFTDPGGAETLSDYSATIDWNDGTGTSAGTITLNGSTFTVTGAHTYAEEGTYAPTVTINHDTSTPTLVTDSIKVSDPAIIATGGFTLNAVEGALSTSQTVATFTDPGGAEALADYSANINWGDGNQSAGTISYNSGTGLFTVSGAHQYAEEGSNTITVTILHDAAPNTIVTSSASVSDPAVIATGGFTLNAIEGNLSASQTVATFTDPGGAEALADYSAVINWGDGNQSSGVITFNAGIFTVSGAHKYAEEGNDTITVTISHDAASNTIVTSSGVVADAALTQQGVTVAQQTEGISTGNIVVASFKDANPGNNSSDFNPNPTIDWGDGQTSAGTLQYVGNNTYDISGSHTYAEESTAYNVSVAITDEGGSSITVGSQINVQDAPLVLVPVTPAQQLEGNSTGNIVVFEFIDTNPGAPPPLSDFPANPLIDWGDGQSSVGTLNYISTGTFTVNSNPVTGSEYTITASHTYAEKGNYTASDLTFADAGGSALSLSSQFVVNDAPLTAPVLSNNFNPVEGINYNGVVATFTDQNPGSTANAADFNNANTTINWGDGTTTQGVVAWDAVNNDYTVSGSHKYAEEGPQTLIVNVHDIDGSSNVNNFAVPVADAPLTNPIINFNPVEGISYNGVVATFTDANPGSGANAADFNNAGTTINWGDGNTTQGVVAWDAIHNDYTVSGSHTYVEEGTQSVVVNINDVGGSQSLTTSTVTVADAPLTGSATSINAVATYAFNNDIVATFTDADPNGNLADYNATIKWGDATGRGNFAVQGTIIDTGTHDGSGNEIFAVEGSHTYANGGTFNLVVTINDQFHGGSQTIVNTSTAIVDVAPQINTNPYLLVASENPPNSIPLTFTSTDLIAQASDADGFPQALSLGTNPLTIDFNTSHGTISSVTHGGVTTYTYTPDLGYTGPDGFTYTVTDGFRPTGGFTPTGGQFVTATGRVEIAVENITLDNASILVTATQGAVIGNLQAAGNPQDISTFTEISDSVGGAFTVNGTELVVNNPSLLVGGNSVEVTLMDTNINHESIQKTFTVNVIDVAPVGLDATFSTLATPANPGTVSSNVLANATDFRNNGEPLTAILLRDVGHGKLVFNKDGSFSYTPTLGFIGVDSFEFAISDGLLITDPVVTFDDQSAGAGPHNDTTARLTIDFLGPKPLYDLENSVVTVNITGTRDVTEHLNIAQSHEVNTLGNHIYYKGQLVGEYSKGPTQVVIGFNELANTEAIAAVSKQIEISVPETSTLHGVKVSITDKFGNTVEQQQALAIHGKNDVAAVQDAIQVLKKNANEIKELHGNKLMINWELVPNQKGEANNHGPALKENLNKPRGDIPFNSTFSNIPGIWNIKNNDSALKNEKNSQSALKDQEQPKKGHEAA